MSKYTFVFEIRAAGMRVTRELIFDASSKEEAEKKASAFSYLFSEINSPDSGEEIDVKVFPLRLYAGEPISFDCVDALNIDS